MLPLVNSSCYSGRRSTSELRNSHYYSILRQKKHTSPSFLCQSTGVPEAGSARCPHRVVYHWPQGYWLEPTFPARSHRAPGNHPLVDPVVLDIKLIRDIFQDLPLVTAVGVHHVELPLPATVR